MRRTKHPFDVIEAICIYFQNASSQHMKVRTEPSGTGISPAQFHACVMYISCQNRLLTLSSRRDLHGCLGFNIRKK